MCCPVVVGGSGSGSGGALLAVFLFVMFIIVLGVFPLAAVSLFLLLHALSPDFFSH